METSWSDLTEKLVESAKEKKIPLMGTFELTARCNLSCKMCYVNRSADDQEAIQKELTTDQWIDLARQARDAGMLYLLLTGGEVFLRPDIREICDEISKLGIIITIYTNGTLITSENIKWLKKISMLKLCVTLYGASPDTYEKVCGESNVYSQVVHVIDLMISEGINVGIRTTVVKSNACDYKYFVDFALKRKKVLGLVNYISPRLDGNVNQLDQERLDPIDLIEYEEKLMTYFVKKKDLSLKLKKTNSLDILFKQDLGLSIDDNSPFRCNAGNSSFWITWNGFMVPCGLMIYPTTSPIKNGFRLSWIDLKKECSLIPICYECRKCEYYIYCNTCPARLYNETGFYNETSNYLCQIAKSRKISFGD